MRTIEVPVYTYDEFPNKEKLLEKYRSFNVEHKWYDYIEAEFKEDSGKLGYEDIEINFSGFWNQGDGASFTASVDLAKWIASHDPEKYKPLLAEIDEGLIAVKIKRVSSHYYHENTCSVDMEYLGENEPLANELAEDIESERKSLSVKLYDDLNSAYDELTSDESVAESLRANEYEFMPDGKIA